MSATRPGEHNVVLVLTTRPIDNDDDHWRTLRKLQQAITELLEDGVQVVGASLHLAESAENVLDVASR